METLAFKSCSLGFYAPLRGHPSESVPVRKTHLNLPAHNSQSMTYQFNKTRGYLNCYEELKLSQASLPNKMKLCAAAGLSPATVIGNTVIENIVLKDIFDIWNPLKSSYTQSGNETDESGRPEKEDTDIAPSTEIQRDNDSNSTENRI